MAEEVVNIDINPGSSINNIRELRNEMKQLRSEMANAEGEEFQKLSLRASELNAEIGRTNSLVTSSGSAFTNFNTMLGRTSKSLLTLDFDQAADQANQLLLISRQLTFKGMISGMKTATGAIRTMGKALLANPLFLIVGIVVALGVALFKLKDSIKPVKIMFDLIGDAIGWVIQLIKDFLDWIGLTSFAEDEAAEKAERAAERRAAAVARANRSIENDMSREIALMQAQGAEIEEIEAAQIRLNKVKLQNFIQETKNDRIRLEVLKKMGIASDEQLDQLAEFNETIKQLNHDLEMSEINIANDRKKREEKTLEESVKRYEEYKRKLEEIERQSDKVMLDIQRKREDLSIKEIEDDIDRQEKIALTKLQRQMEDVDRTKLNKEALLELEQFFEDEKTRIVNEATQKRILKEQEEEEKKNLAIKDLNDKWEELIKVEKQLTDEEKFQNEFDREMEHLNKLLEAKAITQEEYEQRELDRKEVLNDKLEKLEQDRLEEEKKLRKIAQKEAIDQGVDMFGQLAELAEEGSAAQKAAALVSIIAAQGEALAKAVPVALEAASGTGPGAPFVFAATLAGIVGSIGASIASAKSILSSAPGPSPSGGSGRGNVPTPIIQMNQQPSFDNFRDDFAGDMQGQGDNITGTYILESELADSNERKNQIKRKSIL